MARTIYFSDGTQEVLLTEDNERAELARIIRERLGKDAAELYEEVTDTNTALEDELKSYEASCEAYHSQLTDVRDALEDILTATCKQNRQKISQSILSIIQSIDHHL